MINFPKLNNCQLFLVGGAVRDKLMGRPAKDTDYVVYTQMAFQEVVDKIERVGRVYQAKEEFLTIRCHISDQNIDIAFPRTEGHYSDGRRPDYVHLITGDNLEYVLKADACRRDFTINALYESEEGKIYDFFGGRQDIKDGLISCVESPHARFTEDYLRILRALRFAVVLGFRIEDYTWISMYLNAFMLKEIAVERIMIELEKALAVNPWRTLSFLNNLKITHILQNMGVNFTVNNKKKKVKKILDFSCQVW